jgi:hypothetical protein
MKKWGAALLAVLAIISVMCVQALSQQQAAPTAEGQRFMLFQGGYEIVSASKKPVDYRAVFKIDAQTGETWMFAAYWDSKGAYVQHWVHVD